ncbi:bifunctional serine/threonine-protein kinase/formylglycine-generating enzyme family protein [Lignipirellula cremea]|uniref:Serine/threonine-protein kinase PknB n=1 Tax=Lignipirellula cremea TaxID=2528010 RepID=A0A518E2T7_9BACT|nr:bifunctional serine/threonine-protein kinase/formylglycine-generating enzyme family protein [Lignipirellula cremea]QDU98406.1 Serine/threonine-protein kinase PknB [Lignipirellula cremea]
MTQVTQPFMEQVLASGLIGKGELQAVVNDLQKKGLDPQSRLAQELVRRQLLTPFQVKQIAAGKGKSLLLGNYAVLDLLGQGGMGMVLKAEHQRMKRVVALKILSPSLVKNPAMLKRFQREMEAAAKLEHPNIVTAHDADTSGTTHFLVMQYVEGVDLSSLVKQRGPLTVSQAALCLLQAARGLEYAHKQGVVHRDIKPGNLLLDKEGRLKILDMGLALLDSTEADEQLTGTGQIMGTVNFMAPEQARDTSQVDRRADIYALGATLWYLLTGKPMYGGDSTVQKLMAHQEQAIPSLRAACPAVSPALEAVFRKMVAKRPEDRQQSMTEVVADLQRCQAVSSAATAATQSTGLDSPDLPLLERQGLALLLGKAPLEARGDETDPLAMETVAPAYAPRVALGDATFLKKIGEFGMFTWMIITIASLFVIGIVSAGVVLRVKTSVGTVVLEIANPDAIGADVTVDGEQKITINRRGEVPIEIEVDNATHQLRVSKGGFQTFTKEFTASKNKETVIRVHLEPLGQPVPPVSIAPPATPGPMPPVAQVPPVVRPVVPAAIPAAPVVPIQAPVVPAKWDGWPADGPPPAIVPFDEAQAKAHQKAWADYYGVPTEQMISLPDGQTLKMIFIPPGQFVMGANVQGEMQSDPVDVTLSSPFWMAETEATQSQWMVITSNEAWQSSTPDSVSPEHPAFNASFRDAREFCSELTRLEREAGRLPAGWRFDLPTEAQWEYACRAGSQGLYGYGDDPGLAAEYGWFTENSPTGGRPHIHPVRQKKPNAWGLFDMHGNVSEWCRDAMGTLLGGREPFVDSPQEKASERMSRGGNALSKGEIDRAAAREAVNIGRGSGFTGVRPVLVRDENPIVDPQGGREWAADAPSPAVFPFDAPGAAAHQQAWADFLKVPVEKKVSLPGGQTLTMVLIPPGDFEMGCTPAGRRLFPDQHLAGVLLAPQHHVWLTKPFYLSKYEVTAEQWQAVTGKAPPLSQGPQTPADGVTWSESVAFLEQLNQSAAQPGMQFTLPSEAQWEFACRAGTTTNWSFGDDPAQLSKYGYVADKAGMVSNKAEPVGQRLPNAFGLHDMYGNVMEWCLDEVYYDLYALRPLNDPVGEASVKSSNPSYIAKGGNCRFEAYRSQSGAKSNVRDTSIGLFGCGFRAALVIEVK